MKEKVVLRRTEKSLAKALDSAVEHLGGWKSLVSRGETIVLKPNLVAPRHAITGATTSLELLALLAERLRDMGAYPAILETPGMEYRLEETWRFFDLPALASAHGAELLSVDGNDWVSVKIQGGKVLRRARVHRAVLENRVINLPKLKTHIITGATLAMKNLMGICHDDTKRTMHVLGIHRSIVDLNRLITPVLNLIDGTVGMEGDGAVYGVPKKVGMLIAGKNALAADLVSLEVMGLRVEVVPHLNFAIEEFGAPDIKKVGDGFVQDQFLVPRPSKAYLLGYRMLYVVDSCFYPIKGVRFNEYLYRKGIVGTRPYIVKDHCNSCGDCLAICPAPQCLDFERKTINMAECLRCLECVDACSPKAIEIKGVSGNRDRS
jgi:uncharacterized protein (DUF362 family)/Pyruvate/2-oxoacid:ferredoxin oxidoreductase delta subunit